MSHRPRSAWILARSLGAALSVALTIALTPPASTGCKRAPVAGAEAGVEPVTPLDARHDPLRARFDADAASPRLLLLASPT